MGGVRLPALAGRPRAGRRPLFFRASSALSLPLIFSSPRLSPRPCVSAVKQISQTPSEPAPRTHVAAEGPLCYLWVQAERIQLETAPLRRVATARHNLIKGWHPVEAVNRKLIRPSLNEIKEQIAPPRRAPLQKKPVPPDQTNAENFYYVKQMQAKTPMVFVLRDGETLHGAIEWYDRCCLKVNRTEGPNILLYKPAIKYMYKEN
jgi:host factor-I protein